MFSLKSVVDVIGNALPIGPGKTLPIVPKLPDFEAILGDLLKMIDPTSAAPVQPTASKPSDPAILEQDEKSPRETDEPDEDEDQGTSSAEEIVLNSEKLTVAENQAAVRENSTPEEDNSAELKPLPSPIQPIIKKMEETASAEEVDQETATFAAPASQEKTPEIPTDVVVDGEAQPAKKAIDILVERSSPEKGAPIALPKEAKELPAPDGATETEDFAEAETTAQSKPKQDAFGGWEKRDAPALPKEMPVNNVPDASSNAHQAQDSKAAIAESAATSFDSSLIAARDYDSSQENPSNADGKANLFRHATEVEVTVGEDAPQSPQFYQSAYTTAEALPIAATELPANQTVQFSLKSADGASQRLDVVGATQEGSARADGAPKLSKVPAESHVQDKIDHIDRIVKAARVSQMRGESRMKILLNPPQMGSLRIDLSVRDKVLSGNLNVETAAAKELILSQMNDLKEAIEQQGLKVGDLHVSVQHNRDHSQGGRRSENREGAVDGIGSGERGNSVEERMDRPRIRSDRLQVIDLFV